MPNEFLRNLNTGLGLANQVHQFSSNQMKVDEQRRQAQEQKQYRGALSSLQSGRDIDKDIPANVRMQAEGDYLTSQVQKMEASAYKRQVADMEQAKAYRDNILGQDFETMEEVYAATGYDPTSDFSISAQVLGAGLIAEAFQAEEGMNHIFKERTFVKATQELDNTKRNLFYAGTLAEQGRGKEATALALKTINESHSPFFLEETEQGGFNLYFKEFGDDGERQLIREDMSLTDVSKEIEKITPQMSFAMNQDRLETLNRVNTELSENRTTLYSNTGDSFMFLSQMTFEGDLEVVVELPNGKALTDNQGQPLVFSSEDEARQTLKQFLSETDERFTGLDEDARTALLGPKEDKDRTMSATDSARVHSAVLEALEGSDMFLNDVQARELSSQVATLMSEKGEGKELNEAIVQVFKQFIESDPDLKEKTKGFTWTGWLGPNQALKAGDLVSNLIKSLFKRGGKDRVEVDFSETGIPPEPPSKGLTSPKRETTPSWKDY